MFLRICWYAAAYSRELDGGGPLGRTLLGEPVVMYRTADGTAVALEDSCCHRQLSRSLGAVRGDRLRCGYHDLEFASDGGCVSVPGQSRVPPGAAVRAWPLTEKHEFLWIWMGDPDLADEALLPDWWWIGDPGWRFNPGAFLHVRCDYRLITDNLLDLSHLGYVHQRALCSDAIVDFPVKTERDGELVRMTRWIVDRPPPPLFRRARDFGEAVDRWQIVETVPPGHTVVYAGCGPVGAGVPEGPIEYGDGIHLRALNAPTPETETSAFYFYGHVWDFRLDDDAWAGEMHEEFLQTFLEDVEVLEAQQRSIDQAPGRPWIDLGVDAPALAARRRLAERVADEARA